MSTKEIGTQGARYTRLKFLLFPAFLASSRHSPNYWEMEQKARYSAPLGNIAPIRRNSQEAYRYPSWIAHSPVSRKLLETLSNEKLVRQVYPVSMEDNRIVPIANQLIDQVHLGEF